MTAEMATVIAAAITTLGGVFGVAIHEFRDLKKKNESDHGAVMLKLNKVQKSIDKVTDRLDDHIDWHLDTTNK
jgi:hypothetical protein